MKKNPRDLDALIREALLCRFPQTVKEVIEFEKRFGTSVDLPPELQKNWDEIQKTRARYIDK